MRKFLEALATGRPVVVVIDDIHYAEATFLDLLEHLLDMTARQAAVLVVATARLSLLEKRVEWGDREGSVRLALGPLAAGDSGRLVDELLGGEVAADVRDRVVSSAEGNPLFVQQLVSMLVDRGMLTQGRRGLVVHGRPRGAGRPADDPGAARGPPRRADPRGTRRRRAGRR